MLTIHEHEDRLSPSVSAEGSWDIPITKFILKTCHRQMQKCLVNEVIQAQFKIE